MQQQQLVSHKIHHSLSVLTQNEITLRYTTDFLMQMFWISTLFQYSLLLSTANGGAGFPPLGSQFH